jgi:transcriptional regulator with XRE-family HTH domain
MCGGSGKVRPSAAPSRALVGERIALAIALRGFSQYEVAEALDCTQAAVSHWVNAKTLPNYDELFALADLVGVRVSWLLEGGPGGPPRAGRRQGTA